MATVWPTICDRATEIHLSGKSCTLTQALRLLRLASNLETCVVFPCDESCPTTTIVRPNLKSFLDHADLFARHDDDNSTPQNLVLDASLVGHILDSDCCCCHLEGSKVLTIDVVPIERYDSYFSQSEPPFTIGRMQELLTRCPRLRSLSFPTDATDMLSLVFPPTLKALHITLPPPSNPFRRQKMKIYLDAPRVERLTLRPNHDEDLVAICCVQGTLSSLQHLTLHRVRIDPDISINTTRLLKTIAIHRAKVDLAVGSRLRERFRCADITFQSCHFSSRGCSSDNDAVVSRNIRELAIVDNHGDICFRRAIE